MTGTAFDVLAARYEALWSATSIGRSQREQVWRWVDPLFQRGQRLLDLGCGIGDDAVHFAARGILVHGIDASREMVREAASRGVDARQLPIERLSAVEDRFDGAISNFGALNCVERLEPVAKQLARLIVPGGALAICVIGRTCAWEIAHYFPRRKAFRRCSARTRACSAGILAGVDGRRDAITVYYPTVRQLSRAFTPHFGLERFTGIGLFVPPSYITGLSNSTISRLAALDRRLAHLPILRAMADHRLLTFRRL